MNRNIAVTLIAAGVAAAGIGGWFWYQQRQASQVVDTVIEEPAVAEVTPEPEGPPPIQHPIETPDAEAVDVPQLPELADSDAPLSSELAQLAGEGTVIAWLMPDAVIRRFVATVDNLPRPHVADRTRVLRGAPGQFAVERTTIDATSGEERIVVAPSNAARYDGAIAALEALDMNRVADIYRRWYPRLQEVYEGLGYPDRYFNDRVVAVVDHLLETPVSDEPLELVQPRVLYEYADASIEARSAGQKLLIRMGPAHAAAVKRQLAVLRAAIANDN